MGWCSKSNVYGPYILAIYLFYESHIKKVVPKNYTAHMSGIIFVANARVLPPDGARSPVVGYVE